MATGKVDMKIVMLGKEYVGKTCLAQRYLHERFSESGNYNATIGAAFGAKRLIVDGKPIVMGIWDTAGSERYEAMSRIYYRGAKAAIVCYDITDSASFERVKFWVDELRKNEMDCKIYLCGTKKDLIDESPKQRQVDVHDATDFADEYSARLFETSSKTGENIAGLFNLIAQQYAEDSKVAPKPTERSTISLRDDGQPQRSCRC